MSNVIPAIVLDPPVKIDGGKLDAISLREPTVKEVIAAETLACKEQTSVRYFAVLRTELIKTVSGLTDDAVSELPISKFEEAGNVMAGLIEAGMPETGAQANETLEIPLDPSVKVGAISYDRLSLFEPTVRRVRMAEAAMDGAENTAAFRRYQANLVGGVSGIGWAAVQELPISMLNRAGGFLMGFLAVGRRAGGS